MTRKSLAPVVLALLAASIGGASAMTINAPDTNIVGLLQQSSDIVVGRVESVTDGLDAHGIPYTEVNLEISESIRGAASGTYTFRQFGLLRPRLTADGARRMMPSPEGFPKYEAGDEIVLFLRPSAAWTGFRMPAGLTQGKFTLGPGRVANESGNVGLFRGVHIERGLATDREKQMIATDGPANPDTFLSFVRHAVQGRWVESGHMTGAGGGVAPTEPPRSEIDPSPASKKAVPPAAPATPADPNANVATPGSGR